MDQHGMKFVVDTSQVAKGFRDYKSAVDGIFKSLDQFEAHVQKTMKGVAAASNNKAALNSFKKGIEAFGNVKIDTSAARKISQLGAAFSDFKAPTASQSANLRGFFKSISGLPNLTSAYRAIKAIDDINVAMRGFQAPPASQSARLVQFSKAMAASIPNLKGLGSVSGISGIANELASISIAINKLKVPSAGQVTNLGNMALALRAFNFGNLGNTAGFMQTLNALGSFKAPSQSQIKNLSDFVHAVGQMKVPANGAGIARVLESVAKAGALANSSLTGLRSALPNLNNHLARTGASARGATLQMNGLQNAFSGTFQIGSALRSILGSLTIGELGRAFFDATNKMMQFRAQMSVISKATGFADLQLQYARETANRFGMSLDGVMQGFGKLSIAASKTGMNVQATRGIFEGFSSAMAVLGTTTERQNDVWLALQQVMNKGYLSAEELNQQLNEHLPGAMSYASEYATKMGTTLEKGLSDKALKAQEVLAFMAKRMKEDFGPSMAEALMRPAAQFNILKNNITTMFQEIGSGKASTGVANLLKSIGSLFDQKDSSGFASSMSDGISNAANKAAEAINWLKANWESLKGPISTVLELMGKWMILSAGLQIGKSIIAPLFAMRTAFATVGSTMSGMVGTQGAVAAGFTRLTAGVMPLNSGLAGLGRAGVMLAGNFALLNSSSRVASVGLVALNGAANVARVGMAGLMAAGRGVVGFFGGPWGVAFMAAAAAVGYLTNQYYDMAAAFSNTQPVLNDVNAVLMQMGGAALYGATNSKDLAEEQRLGATKVDKFAGAVGGLAQQLWNAAVQARTLKRELLEANLTKLQGQRDSLTGGDGFWGNVGRGAKEFMSGGDYSKGVIRDLQKIDPAIARVKADLADLGKTPMDKFVTPAMREIYAPAGGGGKPTPGAAGGKKAKGRKGPSEESQLKSLTSLVDGLMDKLAQSNEVWKLQQDTIADVTKEARALLDFNAFKKWTQGLKNDADNGKVGIDSLIEALKTPGAISEKAMADIQKRYGKNVQDIIGMLRAQQADYETAVKQATIKQADRTYKQVQDLTDIIGESNPLVKMRSEFMKTVGEMGEKIMSPDTFKTWFSALQSGAMSLEDAIKQLSSTTLALPDDVIESMAQRANVGVEELRAAVNGLSVSMADLSAEAQRASKFGGELLHNMQQEAIMAGLGAKNQRIYAQVLDEVKAARARKKTVTQEQIQGLIAEAKATDDLIERTKALQEFRENNGIRSYINDLKTAGEAANELDKNVLQSLEDQLFSLGKTGKFSFSAIFDTIHEGMLRFSTQQITKGIASMLGGGKEGMKNGDPSFMGSLMQSIGLGKYEAPNPMEKVGVNADGSMRVFITNSGEYSSVPQFDPKKGPSVTVDGIAAASGSTQATNAWGPGTAANDNLAGADAATATTQKLVAETTQQTATSFGTTMTNMMPMIGMAFAGTFKSPIAQIGSMFLSMMMQQMMASQGGGGGGGGLLGSLFKIGMSFIPGGGAAASLAGSAASTIAANPGIFKEGGYPGSPVARTSVSPSVFANAPHYAEGTANTSGIPAILHDNEAVIPLSRGRKVPVEMSGGGAGKGTVVNNNWNISTPNPDGFRKSRQQLMSDMHGASNRAFRRNHG